MKRFDTLVTSSYNDPKYEADFSSYRKHSVISLRTTRSELKEDPVWPEKEFEIKNIPAFFIFIVILGGMLAKGIYTFSKGDPIKYLKGYDSMGNVCGIQENIPIQGVILSGKNLSVNKYAFYIRLTEYENAINPARFFKMKKKQAATCVKQCSKNLTSCNTLVEDSGYTNIHQH